MEDNTITVNAVASGSTATSGKIIATRNGVKKEIPAVVFSESEVQRLFEIIKKPQQPTQAISNSGFVTRLKRTLLK